MNKIFLIGNLTRDPELRTTGSGTSVCTFSIAVNRRFANQSGERATDYFNVVAWRALGDLCAKYLAKGRKVAICGELQTRSYDDKDGNKRYVTEIIADDVEFLTPRKEEGSGGYGMPEDPGAYAGSERSNALAPNEGFADIDDDDLPF